MDIVYQFRPPTSSTSALTNNELTLDSLHDNTTLFVSYCYFVIGSAQVSVKVTFIFVNHVNVQNIPRFLTYFMTARPLPVGCDACADPAPEEHHWPYQLPLKPEDQEQSLTVGVGGRHVHG